MSAPEAAGRDWVVRVVAPGPVPDAARAAVEDVLRPYAGGPGACARPWTVAGRSPDARPCGRPAGATAASSGDLDGYQWRWEPVGEAEAPRQTCATGALRGRLFEAVRGLDLGVAVVPAGLPAPELVVCDVDSTLIQDEVIELLAEHAGVRARVAAVTAAAMRGELDFAASLRARVATLEGLDEAVLSAVVAAVRPTPGAQRLIDAVHASGGRICAVSGGFTQILEPLARAWGLDGWAANVLRIRDGRLTGEVSGPIVDRAAKAEHLQRWREGFGIRAGASLAVGDGANDLDLLAAADVGVAFCAKPILRQAADAVLDFPRLDAVLPLVGLLG